MLNAKGHILVSHKPIRCLCCSLSPLCALLSGDPQTTSGVTTGTKIKPGKIALENLLLRGVPTQIRCVLLGERRSPSLLPPLQDPCTRVHFTGGFSPVSSHRCPLRPPGTQAVVGNSMNRGGGCFIFSLPLPRCGVVPS